MKKMIETGLSLVFEVVLLCVFWPWRRFLLFRNSIVSFFELYKSDGSLVLSGDELRFIMLLTFGYLSLLLVIAVTILLIFFFKKKWLLSGFFYLLQAILFTCAFASQPSNFYTLPILWIFTILEMVYMYVVVEKDLLFKKKK